MKEDSFVMAIIFLLKKKSPFGGGTCLTLNLIEYSKYL